MKSIFLCVFSNTFYFHPLSNTIHTLAKNARHCRNPLSKSHTHKLYSYKCSTKETTKKKSIDCYVFLIELPTQIHILNKINRSCFAVFVWSGKNLCYCFLRVYVCVFEIFILPILCCFYLLPCLCFSTFTFYFMPTFFSNSFKSALFFGDKCFVAGEADKDDSCRKRYYKGIFFLSVSNILTFSFGLNSSLSFFSFFLFEIRKVLVKIVYSLKGVVKRFLFCLIFSFSLVFWLV